MTRPASLLRPRFVRTAFLVGLFFLVATPADAQDETYAPGLVTILHEWLGEQCSFVPDLDVGDCCREHDIAYQTGGDRSDRRTADVAFRQCIFASNRPLIAGIYYWGVRVFGWLFFNFN